VESAGLEALAGKPGHDSPAKASSPVESAGLEALAGKSGARLIILEFDRQATSMEEAILSAIQNVESVPIGAQVLRVKPDHLVTSSEIAAKLIPETASNGT
jgi:hypothetical protein